MSPNEKFDWQFDWLTIDWIAESHTGLQNWLSSTGGAPLKQFVPSSETFCLPEIWSKSNRKISITIEICITVDFTLEKNSWNNNSRISSRVLKISVRATNSCFITENKKEHAYLLFIRLIESRH